MNTKVFEMMNMFGYGESTIGQADTNVLALSIEQFVSHGGNPL